MKIPSLAVKIIIVSTIILGAYGFHHSGLLQTLIHWIQGLGPEAPVVFLLIYIVCSIFFVPSILLTFAGGFLFNFWTAAVLSILGSGFGAVSAFLIGRYLIRGAVEKQAHKIRGFEKISDLVKRKGWKIVLLARLSPIFPFLIGNYAFGTTRMRARHYFFASVLGTIPSTLVYTYSGRLAGGLAGAGSHARTPQEWGLLVLGLAASIGVSLYLRRLAQMEFKRT